MNVQSSIQKAISVKGAVEAKSTALPNLVWAAGTVHEILVQPGEQFYVFAIQQNNGGSTVILRIANPHTGAPMAMTSDSPIYDLLKEAYLRKLNVQVAYRDFGPDPQAGINRLCIDRVILAQ